MDDDTKYAMYTYECPECDIDLSDEFSARMHKKSTGHDVEEYYAD